MYFVDYLSDNDNAYLVDYSITKDLWVAVVAKIVSKKIFLIFSDVGEVGQPTFNCFWEEVGVRLL